MVCGVATVRIDLSVQLRGVPGGVRDRLAFDRGRRFRRSQCRGAEHAQHRETGNRRQTSMQSTNAHNEASPELAPPGTLSCPKHTKAAAGTGPAATEEHEKPSRPKWPAGTTV